MRFYKISSPPFKNLY